MRPDMEQELRNALGRVDPPHGFAERVTARLRPQTSKPLSRRLSFSWAVPAWPAVALALLLMLTVGFLEQRRSAEAEQARGEAAKESILQALHIAGGKLHATQEKVRQLND